MPLEGHYEPATWSVAADQVALYESSGGTEGTVLNGAVCVVLWTRGRSTGHVRKSPVIRVTDGERYAVLGSMGGAPKDPSWVGNIAADPHVTLQDGPGDPRHPPRPARLIRTVGSEPIRRSSSRSTPASRSSAGTSCAVAIGNTTAPSAFTAPTARPNHATSKASVQFGRRLRNQTERPNDSRPRSNRSASNSPACR